jgi:predicted TIM-barrel fold metal-dependent hydrolase
MDVDGVDAEVLYPPQRTMRHFMLGEEPDVHLAGIQAYNNWLCEEYCGVAPDRLIGIAQIPNLGVEAAVKEMRRCHGKGMRGVIISSWPSGEPALSPADDPFWAAAQELDLPVSIHISLVSRAQQTTTSARKGERSLSALASAGITTMPVLLAETIYSGMFDRFPRLKMVGVEVGAGWVPYHLEQMDDRYWRNRHWTKTTLKRLPSEYFHEHWAVTFMLDGYAVQNRHAVGLANMMWSTDYPHHGCDWPYSRKVIEEMFRGVAEAEKRQIVAGNAVALYKLN